MPYNSHIAQLSSVLNSLNMFKLVLVCLAAMVAVVFAQSDYEHFFGGPNPAPAPAQLPAFNSAPNSVRSTGPHLFPMSPDGGETSGVVVGASGYGFVPPRSSFGHAGIQIPRLRSHFGVSSSGPSFGGFF